MRRHSRSSKRWRIATAVVALTLCALPKAPLADGGGNGRLVAAKLADPSPLGATAGQGIGQPISYVADGDAEQPLRLDRSIDDGDRIGDDSDVASVEGSANDDGGVDGEFSAGPF
ncbi:MAG TPA: hypothetical protein VLV76_23655 [Candidatus Acidoferrum sp.]|nr:hypothetical protein [Candidatus Acidoferrum sp.]